MLNARRALVLMLGSCLFFFFHCNRPLKKYYRINSRWTKEGINLTPADINSDGVDEFVQINEGQLDVVDQSLRNHFKSFSMTEYKDFDIAPIIGQSLDSIAFYVFSKTQDSMCIDLLTHVDQSNKETRTIRPLYRFPREQRQNKGHYDAGMAYIAQLPGHNASLFQLNTARSLIYDRGLLAFDPLNNIELWRFTCGPQVHSLSLINIDADSCMEIIFGSYAPFNGMVRNGTSDDSSYVFALDDDGHLLWRKAFGGQFTGAYAYPGRFRPSGLQIAVSFHNFSFDNKIFDSVVLLNAQTGNKISGPRIYGDKIPVNNDIRVSRVADMNKDGMDEIIIGNTDGYVRILDNSLNILHISNNFHKEVQVKAIVDMNGDGLMEIVALLPHEKLLILDNTLQEMITYPLEIFGHHQITPVANGATTRLLLCSLSTHKYILPVWRLLELQQAFIPFETYTGTAKFIWWGLGGVGLFGVLLITFFTRKRFLTQIFLRLLMQAKLFDSTLLLNSKGIVRAAGAHWLQMAQAPAEILAGRKLINIKHIPKALRFSIEKNLKNKSDSQFRFIIEQNGRKTPILVQMEYIKPLALYRATLRFISEDNFIANIKHWSSAAQKLAHGIKNPLTSMKLNLDELAAHLEDEGAASETTDNVSSISLQIDKLRRMADGFTRFIEFEEPELTAGDVNDFLQKALAQLYDDIPRSVRISLDLNPALPLALINTEQLRFAFGNVLFNAVQSIEDHGAVLIQTNFVQLSSPDGPHDYVEIRIQDNGVGIDADVLSKVTDAYFTTKKEGTGLGLNLVVKIMQMLGGEFDIESRLGEGTTVFLRLKAVA